MPNAPLRRCLVKGCAALVKRGRCVEHERIYDKSRGTAQARGYTYRWAKFSKAWLRAHPLCGERADGKRYAEHSQCTREGRRVAAECTDHIDPPKGDMVKFWEGPFQSLCSLCNTRKAIELEGGFGR